MDHFDVIVIGAGPSGSFASYHLSKDGLRVLMIDKARFPRNKICGGLLSNKTMDLLGEWKKEIPIHQAIHDINLYSREYKSLRLSGKNILGSTIMRSDFDLFLVNKSREVGTVFLEETKFSTIKETDKAVVLSTSKGTFSASYIIAADGALSETAKKIGLRPLFFKAKMGFAYSQIISVPDGFNEKDKVDLFFIPFLGGFGWCFPLNGAINIGVGACLFSAKPLLSYYYKFRDTVLNTKNIKPVSSSPRGAPIPAGGFNRCLGKDRVLLVGDAAGGVDSFSGEGIDHALLSGHYAAKAIHSSYSSSTPSAIDNFIHQYDSTFSTERRLSLLISILTWHKGERLFRIFNTNREIASWLCNIMEKPSAYKQFYLAYNPFNMLEGLLKIKKLE